MKIIFIISAIIFSIATSYYAQPLLEKDSDIINMITTVITVFAGFLVAIITILGDPLSIPKGTWRTAETRRETYEMQIIKHQWIFFIYLLTIAALFIGALLQKSNADYITVEIKIWVQRIYIFFSAFSFMITFSLPMSLGKIQMKRIDQEIEKRRSFDE